ncbi:MAG: putative ABC transporter permease [Butyricicoccus sp.]|nr:putative ABC transporter permease [Butyricicoccus sp.]
MKEKWSMLRNFYLYFMLYSVIGWLYEVFLEVVVYRWGFSNRGVLFGPYCPIYGTAAVIFILLLTGIKKKTIRVKSMNLTPVVVFFLIVVISTLLELAGSYIMEALTGGWMWDYTRFAWNFQGRIALNPSLRFGAGGMVFLYLFQPAFEKLTAIRHQKALSAVTVLALLLFLLDAVTAFLC